MSPLFRHGPLTLLCAGLAACGSLATVQEAAPVREPPPPLPAPPVLRPALPPPVPLPPPAPPPGPVETPAPPPRAHNLPPAAPPVTPPPPAAVSKSIAVVSLFKRAEGQERAGQWGRAVVTLERALRIEPDNALLWSRLARAHLALGDYRTAADLALRSNSYAGADARLRADNQALMAEAKQREEAQGR